MFYEQISDAGWSKCCMCKITQEIDIPVFCFFFWERESISISYQQSAMLWILHYWITHLLNRQTIWQIITPFNFAFFFFTTASLSLFYWKLQILQDLVLFLKTLPLKKHTFSIFFVKIKYLKAVVSPFFFFNYIFYFLSFLFILLHCGFRLFSCLFYHA